MSGARRDRIDDRIDDRILRRMTGPQLVSFGDTDLNTSFRIVLLFFVN